MVGTGFGVEPSAGALEIGRGRGAGPMPSSELRGGPGLGESFYDLKQAPDSQATGMLSGSRSRAKRSLSMLPSTTPTPACSAPWRPEV